MLVVVACSCCLRLQAVDVTARGKEELERRRRCVVAELRCNSVNACSFSKSRYVTGTSTNNKEPQRQPWQRPYQNSSVRAVQAPGGCCKPRHRFATTRTDIANGMGSTDIYCTIVRPRSSKLVARSVCSAVASQKIWPVLAITNSLDLSEGRRS